MQSIHCINFPKHAVYTLHKLPETCSLYTASSLFFDKGNCLFCQKKHVKGVVHEGRRFA